MLSDRIVSAIRTGVPNLIGALVTYLASRNHIVIDPHVTAFFASLAVFGVSTVYYLLVRYAESHWRWAGLLLGVPRRPKYEAPRG